MLGNDRLFHLLSELDDSELKSLWTTCLRKKPEDEDFELGSKNHKIIVISKEWRAVHGHTLLNRFRNDHELPWKRILIDVADKLKPGWYWTEFKIDDHHAEEDIERAILVYLDDLVKAHWNKLSEAERQKIVSGINESLDHDARTIGKSGNQAGFVHVTVQSLSAAIGTGLIAGGGALLVAQATASGVIGGFFGGVLYQIGLWIIVRIVSWWSGAQLVSGGYVALIGGMIVSVPAIFAFAANALMSTSYRKTIPATLSLLCAHEMRKQLSELEKNQ